MTEPQIIRASVVSVSAALAGVSGLDPIPHLGQANRLLTPIGIRVTYRVDDDCVWHPTGIDVMSRDPIDATLRTVYNDQYAPPVWRSAPGWVLRFAESHRPVCQHPAARRCEGLHTMAMPCEGSGQ